MKKPELRGEKRKFGLLLRISWIAPVSPEAMLFQAGGTLTTCPHPRK